MCARKVVGVLLTLGLVVALSAPCWAIDGEGVREMLASKGGGVGQIQQGNPTDDIADLYVGLLPPEVMGGAIQPDPINGEWIAPGYDEITHEPLVMNGFILTSDLGIFTGVPLNFYVGDPGSMRDFLTKQVDNDHEVSAQMDWTISIPDFLGEEEGTWERAPVIGPEWQWDDPGAPNYVDLFEDLSLTYTLDGQEGIFTGQLIIPEPGTVVMLLSGLVGLLLLWRRRS